MKKRTIFSDGPVLFVDQYGKYQGWHSSLKSLREACGGRVSKMYCDKKDGTAVHMGYVIGSLWLAAFRPVEIPE